MLRELLAPLWRWPLQTPRRFITVVALIAALLGSVGIARAQEHRQVLPRPIGLHTTVSASTAHTSIPHTTTPTGIHPVGRTTTSPDPTRTTRRLSVQSSRAAQAVALSFVRSWSASSGISKTTWQHRILRYADPEFAAALKTVSPANVPATAVTGPSRITRVQNSAATVDVETNAGWQEVTLISTGHIWQVTSILPQPK